MELTPEQKANELIKLYRNIIYKADKNNYLTDQEELKLAKEGARICAQKLQRTPRNFGIIKEEQYWNAVIFEISIAK